MRYICGKFFSKFFSFFFFCHIDHHQHHSFNRAWYRYRIGHKQVFALAEFHHFLGRLSAQSHLHRSAEFMAAVDWQYILVAALVFIDVKDPEGTCVIREHHRFIVEDQKAFAHIFCNRRKLDLLFLDLSDLFFYGLILPVNPHQQRRQLVIGVLIFRMLQVDPVDRFDNPSGEESWKSQRQNKDHCHH